MSGASQGRAGDPWNTAIRALGTAARQQQHKHLITDSFSQLGETVVFVCFTKSVGKSNKVSFLMCSVRL